MEHWENGKLEKWNIGMRYIEQGKFPVGARSPRPQINHVVIVF